MLVAIIVVLSISLTLFGIWARAVLRERTRLASQQFQLQAARLAEAGVHRAMMCHAADPQYQGETWSVPADQLDKTHAAEVRIRIRRQFRRQYDCALNQRPNSPLARFVVLRLPNQLNFQALFRRINHDTPKSVRVYTRRIAGRHRDHWHFGRALLPAIQASRESARRTQCTNQMNQLILAVHEYETAARALPRRHHQP